MGVSAAQLLKDPQALGFQFEALVARDLRVYSSPLRGRLHHWRDNNGHEVDFVVTLDDGRWGAFEVKLNPRRIDEAAASLRRFAEKVDTTTTGDPAVLGVIVVNGFSYLRSDVVAVVNIAALGP